MRQIPKYFISAQLPHLSPRENMERDAELQDILDTNDIPSKAVPAQQGEQQFDAFVIQLPLLQEDRAPVLQKLNAIAIQFLQEAVMVVESDGAAFLYDPRTTDSYLVGQFRDLGTDLPEEGISYLDPVTGTYWGVR